MTHRQLVPQTLHQQRSQGDSVLITPEAKGTRIRLPGQIVGLGIPSVNPIRAGFPPGLLALGGL